MKVQELLEYIIKLGNREKDAILDSIINQFYSVAPTTTISEYYSNEQLFPPDFIREFILTAFNQQLLETPQYYQGLILLSYLYYEIKKYKDCLSSAQKAANIMDETEADSPWSQIAHALIKAIENRDINNDLANKIDLYLNSIESNIPKEDFLLLCPKCGAYNPFFVKKCKKCKTKFSKKERKKAKELKKERENGKL